MFEWFFLSLKLLQRFENFFNESDFLNAVWTINVISKKGKAMKKYNIGYPDGTITLGGIQQLRGQNFANFWST